MRARGARYPQRRTWRDWNDVGTQRNLNPATPCANSASRWIAYTIVLPLPTPTAIPLRTYASTAARAAARLAHSIGVLGAGSSASGGTCAEKEGLRDMNRRKILENRPQVFVSSESEPARRPPWPVGPSMALPA